MSLDWMADAVCASVDPEVWFPERGTGAAAKRICGTCPVRQQCAEFADVVEEGEPLDLRFGVYGGQSASQRTRPASSATRDAVVVRLTGHGMTAAEVAEQLDISDRTVGRVMQRTAPRQPVTCGTRPGYQKHRRNGEPACDPCRQANADADRRLRNTGTTKPLAA